MPDLVRGKLPTDLPAAVDEGVHRHRRVDALTDRHPVFGETVAWLRPTQGRFAGIVADVLYDHALAVAWDAYHDTALPAFIAQAYQRLQSVEAEMPERMRFAVRLMVEQDWLGRYATDAGIDATFRQMSERFAQRFGREVHLETAVADLIANRELLHDQFGRFFPSLVEQLAAEGFT